jgi:hypothetical protein
MNEDEANEAYKEFEMFFDSKYKALFADLGHPYLFVGASREEGGKRVFVAGDLKEANIPDLLMMKAALATAFDNLLAEKVTSETTGFKRKSTDEKISSNDTKTHGKLVVLTTGLSLVYKFLSDTLMVGDVKRRKDMFDNILDIVIDMEGLVSTIELPDVIDMKISVLIDGVKEINTNDKYLEGLKALAKELVDHYMETTS